MTEIPEADPGLTEHIVAIRNRFGIEGLRQARDLIDVEIKIFEDAYGALQQPGPEIGYN